MRLHVLDGLGRPAVLEATRVVVTTDTGTPLALAVELAPGLVDVADVADENFNATLKAHGIDRAVMTGQLKVPRLADFQFQV